MKVGQINLTQRSIRLAAGSTKSKEPRLVIMTKEVYELLSACVAGKKDEGDYVFTRGSEPVLDFRGAWDALCVKAGCPDVLFHDLRRSGVRNLVRAGVTERVAMTISGHKTRSVFDRYDICSESDLRNAVLLLENATDTKTSTRNKVVAIRKQKIA